MTAICDEVIDVKVGQGVGTAIDSRGGLWAWGDNQEGELALGDKEARVEPSLITALNGKRIENVACGKGFIVSLGETHFESSKVMTKISKSTKKTRSKSKSKAANKLT